MLHSFVQFNVFVLGTRFLNVVVLSDLARQSAGEVFLYQSAKENCKSLIFHSLGAAFDHDLR